MGVFTGGRGVGLPYGELNVDWELGELGLDAEGDEYDGDDGGDGRGAE